MVYNLDKDPPTNWYTTFTLDVTLTNGEDNLPSLFQLEVHDGFFVGSLSRVMVLELEEIDPDDFNIIDGKDYTCSFQVFDIDDPRLYGLLVFRLLNGHGTLFLHQFNN